MQEAVTDVFGQKTGQGHENVQMKTFQDPDVMRKVQEAATQQGRYISTSMAGSGVAAPQDSRVIIFPVEGNQAPWFSGSSSPGQTYAPDEAPFVPYGDTSRSAALPVDGRHIYFEHGASSLNKTDRKVLQQVAQDAMFAPVDRVTVEGHASARSESSDPVQGRILNLKESMNRSYEVSKNLIQQGVPPEKIKTVSWGDSNLAPGINEAEARRVDIFAGER